MSIFYHGTPNPKKILKNGFDFEHPRMTDSGDFGWGVYLTTNLSRAKVHGIVLNVEVDLSKFALVPNPYFLIKTQPVLPKTGEEHLFHQLAFNSSGEMLTVTDSKTKREFVSKRIRKTFLAHGYLGITTLLPDRETVVFDPQAIVSISG